MPDEPVSHEYGCKLGRSIGLEPDVVPADVPAFANFRTEAAEIAERVKALSDPSRLVLLKIIRDFAMDNTQMADYLGLARPTVSIHAKLLREAGLIETRQEGRAAVHTLNVGELRRLFQDLERFLRLPDS